MLFPHTLAASMAANAGATDLCRITTTQQSTPF